ncbi:MAG: cytochrome c oxidase subunit II [Acidobacteriota bacterium]|nr:cytochrome c oxidase subunit II [Acidobacteriota bacterium]
MNLWPKRFPLFPETASRLAQDVDQLYFFALLVTAVFSLLIAALIFYFIIRFRRRSEDEVGQPERAGLWLEITWSVIPLVILLFMFGWGSKVFFDIRKPPRGAIEYYVTGKQWMWKFQHPEGPREINELHVPLGQDIKLIMTSEDVIHSFYVPALRAKMDVLPGRYTTFWFNAEKAGAYRLFCAEYCGAEHSYMRGSIIVMEPDDYEEWLATRGQTTAAAKTGADLFSAQTCDTCHRSDSAAQAPILHGLFGKEEQLADGSLVLVDENYLRESILNPAAKVVAGYNALMPTYQGRLSEEDLVGLILYIKSLGGPDSADASASNQATTQASSDREE